MTRIPRNLQIGRPRAPAGIAKASRRSRVVGLNFWILIAPVTILRYRIQCTSRHSPASPFDKEFAGGPVMTTLGIAGHFFLGICAEFWALSASQLYQQRVGTHH